MAEIPSGEGPRYQPEFSSGERLSRLEADLQRATEDRKEIQLQLARQLQEQKELFEEKLTGLSARLTAINSAQKEAVDKAEKATAQRFDTFVEQNDRKAEVSQNRIAALERGESSGHGEKEAIISLQNRQIALVGVIITIIVVILQYHP